MTRKVAILYPASVPWFARCLDGIRQYARQHGDWHLISSPPTLSGAEESALTLSTMKGWKGDAIIIASNVESELRRARKLRIPVINLAGGRQKSFGIPRVMVDHYQAGQMAASHLLDRELRHLAFFGWRDLWYSDQRRMGFVERAAKAGVKCDVFLRDVREESNLNWHQRVAGPAQWLASLPRPSGILAVHDYRAQFLADECHDCPSFDQLLREGRVAIFKPTRGKYKVCRVLRHQSSISLQCPPCREVEATRHFISTPR